MSLWTATLRFHNIAKAGFKTLNCIMMFRTSIHPSFLCTQVSTPKNRKVTPLFPGTPIGDFHELGIQTQDNQGLDTTRVHYIIGPHAIVVSESWKWWTNLEPKLRLMSVVSRCFWGIWWNEINCLSACLSHVNQLLCKMEIEIPLIAMILSFNHWIFWIKFPPLFNRVNLPFNCCHRGKTPGILSTKGIPAEWKPIISTSTPQCNCHLPKVVLPFMLKRWEKNSGMAHLQMVCE